ncbi:glutamyl-tRNA reductase [Zafaria cholistanensis]|uniref:Glutamyl-tRNA reductase n=1 Tax=Zafaria cholistanensis TaxID=1682741 RepID=A0A5A7NQC8_9MICC|nr:glutamyl-tRNA reductase [Zafaria cholistanensis]
MLLALVATHRNTGLEILARLRAGPTHLASSVDAAARAAIRGTVVLATCNRFEIYCEVASAQDTDAVFSALAAHIREHSGPLPSDVLPSFVRHTGPAVAEHLFAVAAGLDSAVAGEREIAGQVRRALIQAQAAGTACGTLVRLFQAASRTAKDICARTDLGGAGRSIIAVAIERAISGSRHADLSAASAVVMGTGAYAGCTIAALKARRCSNISVYSRSGRAEEFAAARGARALTRADLPAAIGGADVVVGCSGAGPRIDAAALEEFRAGAPRRLAIIDLALDHDFDPDVRTLPEVELITLDSVRLAAPREEAEQFMLASDMVRQAARCFEEQQKLRAVDAAVVALRGYIQQVLALEMSRVRDRHGCTATAEEVQFALRRMVRQLLHVPSVRARELAAAGRQDQYIEALEVLFGLSLQPVADESSDPHLPGFPETSAQTG